MSLRTVPVALVFALLLAAWPVTSRASVAPADSTAAAAPADTSVAPAPEPAPPPAASESKSGSKDEAAKEEAKDASKAEKAEKAKAAKEAKKARDAAKKAAAKKPSKPEAAKGTVKPVEAAAQPGTMPVKPSTPPQRVQVQHILIGFSGSVPGKMISRNKDEAKKLAYELLDRARKGEDFNELVAKYTDDSPPGIYGMCEKGLQPGPGEYPRDGMVAAFGNVGFNISPGNIGIADYDPQSSPFGYHIIKRLK